MLAYTVCVPEERHVLYDRWHWPEPALFRATGNACVWKRDTGKGLDQRWRVKCNQHGHANDSDVYIQHVCNCGISRTDIGRHTCKLFLILLLFAENRFRLNPNRWNQRSSGFFFVCETRNWNWSWFFVLIGQLRTDHFIGRWNCCERRGGVYLKYIIKALIFPMIPYVI